jgi:3-hydroxybutyryl-CoA dehydrogenase
MSRTLPALTVQSAREDGVLHERLGIAGSGAIACGLAAAAARQGEVVLWARSSGSAQRARDSVHSICGRLSGAINASHVRVETDLAALGEATVVIEAVAEDEAIKAGVLGDLGRVAGEGALVATTTSSLSIERLAHAAGVPERFVGLHVFNPVPKMKLVELAYPEQAGPEVRSRARDLCEHLGKVPVEVPDLPGFVVNRLLFPYLFSAVELLDETGMAPRDVDTAMTLGAGHPMGPLALLDFIGLDVAEAIGDEIGTPVPDRVRTLVEQGALGKKSGRGLYDY